MKNAAVLLFCGDPRRDSWQKRLPRHFLATIHRSLRRLIGTIAGADLFTVSANHGRVRVSGAAFDHVAVADTLGQQIEVAVRQSFAAGYRRVIILAGDVVLLTRDVVVDALDALDAPSASIALGRSGDGGFYLAGFNRLPHLDWDAVVGCRERAADALIAAAGARSVPLTLLPTVDDVDSIADALRLISLRGAFIRSRVLVRALVSLLLSTFAATRRITGHLAAHLSPHNLRGPPLGIARF
jgi:glycosyltransferase A (GT-A) superfamily protein (DUF2064 family)